MRNSTAVKYRYVRGIEDVTAAGSTNRILFILTQDSNYSVYYVRFLFIYAITLLRCFGHLRPSCLPF